MKINDKDRSQLLRMAGNIACGIAHGLNPSQHDNVWELYIANCSARIAIETLKAVDREIGNINSKEEQ